MKQAPETITSSVKQTSLLPGHLTLYSPPNIAVEPSWERSGSLFPCVINEGKGGRIQTLS